MSEFKKFTDDLEALLHKKIDEEEIRHRYWKESAHKDILEIMQYVEHFLSDADIRERDPEYTSMQEQEMRKLINLIRKGDIQKAKEIDFLHDSK